MSTPSAELRLKQQHVVLAAKAVVRIASNVRQVYNDRCEAKEDECEYCGQYCYCAPIVPPKGSHPHHDQSAPAGGVSDPCVMVVPGVVSSMAISTSVRMIRSFGSGTMPPVMPAFICEQTTSGFPRAHPSGAVDHDGGVTGDSTDTVLRSAHEGLRVGVP